MRDIAVAADLSPGNLYHYFGGKDELLFFCQDRSLDRLLDRARRGARGSRGRSPIACAMLRSRTCSAWSTRSRARPRTSRSTPCRRACARRIVAKRDRYERGVRALVADGIRAGALHAADATIATRAFLGALNWTAHWFRPEGPQTPQRRRRSSSPTTPSPACSATGRSMRA